MPPPPLKVSKHLYWLPGLVRSGGGSATSDNSCDCRFFPNPETADTADSDGGHSVRLQDHFLFHFPFLIHSPFSKDFLTVTIPLAFTLPSPWASVAGQFPQLRERPTRHLTLGTFAHHLYPRLHLFPTLTFRDFFF